MTASHSPILAYDSSDSPRHAQDRRVSGDPDEYRPEPVPEPQAPAWRDGSVRIGIHTSIAQGFANSLESASKLGCNALQIFSASPRMWPRVGGRIAEIDASEFRAKRAAFGLGPVVIHANYLINLATSDPVMRVRSIQAFHDEMVRGMALGADYLVVHPGSCCGKTPGRGKSIEEGIRDVAQAIRQAARGVRLCQKFDDFRDCRLRLLLENTSGMGAAIGSRFEELKAIIDALPELPVGICLDTAHAFHAGYEIHTEAGLAQTIAALDRTVGLGRVAALHVNDSKTLFGSRVDRHDHIGRGKIGLEAFRRILSDGHTGSGAGSGVGSPVDSTGVRKPDRTGSGGNETQVAANQSGSSISGFGGFPGRAFILETPIDKPGDDRRNVRRLWGLVGISVKQAPRAQDGFTMLRTKKKIPRAPNQHRRGAVGYKASPTAQQEHSQRSNREKWGSRKSLRSPDTKRRAT